MDVKVQRGADVGVAENRTKGLVVAFALNTPRGECVTQAMEAAHWQTKCGGHFLEVVAHRLRLGRIGQARDHGMFVNRSF